MVMYSDIVEINLVYMLLYMNYIQAALWFLRCVSISLYMRHILTTCNTCSSLDGLLPATRQKKRCGSTLSESDWWWTQAINERNVVPGRWSKPPWYMWSIYTYLIIYILFSFYMYMYKYTYTYIYIYAWLFTVNDLHPNTMGCWSTNYSSNLFLHGKYMKMPVKIPFPAGTCCFISTNNGPLTHGNT